MFQFTDEIRTAIAVFFAATELLGASWGSDDMNVDEANLAYRSAETNLRNTITDRKLLAAVENEGNIVLSNAVWKAMGLRPAYKRTMLV